jgi:nucleoside-diphosphate-sugar epimerase
MNTSPIAVVTGANGFVGSHLVDLLLTKNFTVRCVVRKSSDLKWLKDKKIETINSGLQNKEGLRTAFKDASYIFHVAGVVKSKKPEGYFEGNVENTRFILETAMEFKDSLKRILIVSSLTATGPSLNGLPVDETTSCNPITTYGKSKFQQEELVIKYMPSLPITICRAPAVYGERDTEILIFFKTFAGGLMTTIGFDKKTISLIHVSDLVYGFYLAALNDKSKGEIYFISSEKLYTWEEIGKVTSEVMNKKPFSVKVPHSIVYLIASIAQFFALFSSKPATLNIEKAKDITRNSWTCSTLKAMNDFGYKQNVSIEVGIKRTVDWYKMMKWL